MKYVAIIHCPKPVQSTTFCDIYLTFILMQPSYLYLVSVSGICVITTVPVPLPWLWKQNLVCEYEACHEIIIKT